MLTENVPVILDSDLSFIMPSPLASAPSSVIPAPSSLVPVPPSVVPVPPAVVPAPSPVVPVSPYQTTHVSLVETPDESPKKLLVPLTLQVGSTKIPSKALVDNGSDDCLISSSLVRQYEIPTVALKNPIAIYLADGLPAKDAFVTHRTTVLLVTLGDHIEMRSFYVHELAFPIILGMDWLQDHNPSINWPTLTMDFASEYCTTTCLPAPSSLAIASISSDKLTAQVYPFVENDPPPPSSQVPGHIFEYFPTVFDDSAEMTLPDHSEFDFAIDLVPGFSPPHGKIYSLTPKESAAMTAYVKENLGKGFIRPSTSPAAAPCFFVTKSSGELRPIQDYRGLNAGTIKNRYPVPLIQDLLRSLSNAQVFSIFDLRSAYNQIRIKKGDEWKAAFICKDGLFEPLVMGFGHCDAVNHFQSVMNRIFKELLGKTVLVYLDDIIVYSDNREEHEVHCHAALAILAQYGFRCKLSKCVYAQRSLNYLGYVLSADGISMDPKKTSSISDWPEPKNVKDIQVFLGFCNFYRRFVPNYSTLTQPLTALLRKDIPPSSFPLGPSEKECFSTIKSAFLTNVFLQHPDESAEFILETDASDYGVGGVLSQYSKDDPKSLRPVAFFSRQLQPAERNYEIYDKELLAIIACLKEWRHFLQNSTLPFIILTDHKNLEYFMTTKQLTRRQARWSLFLSEFDFKLSYRPGSRNGKPDLLSRRSDYQVDAEPHNLVQLLKPSMVISALQTIFSPKLNRLISPAQDWPLFIADYLANHNVWLETIPEEFKPLCLKYLDKMIVKTGTLCYTKGPECIPYLPSWNRTATYKRFHDGLGHLKFDSIFDLVSRRFWWPTMKQDLKLYVKHCPNCQLASSSNEPHANTPIRPVPSVAQPFERWGIDFIQNLAETKQGNKHILTAIDYATRWVVTKAVPTQDTATVGIFLYELMMNYGCPYEIFTDRGSYFISAGLRQFEELQGIRHHASTPYHPQTNGMVERMHAMIGHALTTLTTGRPDRWDEFLAQTTFALRVRKHAVTRKSPFYLLYGVEPRLPGDSGPLLENMAPLDEIERTEQIAEETARSLEALGDARGAAYQRSTAQAEAMRKRNNWDPASDDYYFKIGDMVKLKNHGKWKFEFSWKGPYIIQNVGHPGTYWLIDPTGRRLDSTVNESHLAPWLHPTVDNVEFWDGTRRTTIHE